MHTCLCGAPLIESFVWKGRVYAMEDNRGTPRPHTCPEPEMLAANERWFEGARRIDRAAKPAKAASGTRVRHPPPPPKKQEYKADADL